VALVPASPEPPTIYAIRARAFARVWPLLSTSIPTREIVESYLADVIE
jgi:hypothetical protein